ncbi:hypothetical protein FH972_006841 [Carpinus fangiana]|uniref:Uncharacterized protein n=1 Tax=Carpinus fangiana TaxID=176857 RepID=A0A5N6QWH7_9ROSI|nr:hypothetical protein FH972_006841 [Carpinus fangiana]
MRLDFTGIQPILDSILPFSSCRGTKGATDKETFKIQSKPTRRFTIPKSHHNSIQAVEDPPARPTAIKITQTIRPTNRATTSLQTTRTSLPTMRTILQQTKPLPHGVSQDGSDFLELLGVARHEGHRPSRSFPRWLGLPRASWRCPSLSFLFLLFGFDEGERENCG